MALERMRNAALEVMKHAGARAADMGRYEAEFIRATGTAGDPLPCPACFMRGSINRLDPLPTQDGIGAARCQVCRELVEFEDD